MSLGGALLVPAIRLPRDYGRLEEFVSMAVDLAVAGFIVFGGDDELTPPFLRSIRERAGRPLLIMADYERGAGRMVEGPPELPPAMALGATRSPELAYIAGKITALSARALGVNVVLAPVMDVLSRLGNPILATRAFSDEPELVTRLGLAFIEGVQEEGVIACAKHFPGHGDTTLDSHTSLPHVPVGRAVLDSRELPFRAAARAGVGMMMTAHVVYDALDPDVPATFSERVITDLLLGKWGYGGLVVTDALTMEGAKAEGESAAVRALRAGVDLLLYPEDPASCAREIENAVTAGNLSEERLVHSMGKLAMATGDLVFDEPEPRDLTREYGYRIEEIARAALTLSRDVDGLLAAARDRESGARIVGLIVDDDGVPARAEAFRHRRKEFTAGVVHVTRDGPGGVDDLAATLRRADLIVMGVFSDVRAAKERVGLGATLLGFLREVLREHAFKTLVTVFGHPGLPGDLPFRNLLYAYGDDPSSLRIALDTIFEGGSLTGKSPVTLGKKLGDGNREETI